MKRSCKLSSGGARKRGGSAVPARFVCRCLIRLTDRFTGSTRCGACQARAGPGCRCTSLSCEQQLWGVWSAFPRPLSPPCPLTPRGDEAWQLWPCWRASRRARRQRQAQRLARTRHVRGQVEPGHGSGAGRNRCRHAASEPDHVLTGDRLNWGLEMKNRLVAAGLVGAALLTA